MRRVASTRRRHVGVLRRRPRLDPGLCAASDGAVRRVGELRALLRLVDRGMLSAEEFEREQAKVYRDVDA